MPAKPLQGDSVPPGSCHDRSRQTHNLHLKPVPGHNIAFLRRSDAAHVARLLVNSTVQDRLNVARVLDRMLKEPLQRAPGAATLLLCHSTPPQIQRYRLTLLHRRRAPPHSSLVHRPGHRRPTNHAGVVVWPLLEEPALVELWTVYRTL